MAYRDSDEDNSISLLQKTLHIMYIYFFMHNIYSAFDSVMSEDTSHTATQISVAPK